MTLSKACYDCPNITDNCDRPSCISANGIKRVVMSVNRMIPGPLIQVCQNDIINVIVHNNLRMGESTTIHWHGVLQKDGFQHMDGVGMITQCPIDPHTSFQYRFRAMDVGTQFWHAHVGIQRADGVFGALVIKPKYDVHANKYDFDLNEHIIILNDWFDDTIIARFAFSHHGDQRNRPNSLLINGKGVNIRNETEIQTPRAIFRVKQGYRYRFRLIFAGTTFCPIQLLIDQHELTVIATDGMPVEASNFQAVVLNAAERIDIIINANQKPDNYWIKVKGLGSCQSNKIFQTAILSYEETLHNEKPFEDVTYDLIKVKGRQLNNIILPANESSKNFIQINQLKGILLNPLDLYYDRIRRTPDKKFYFGLQFTKVNNPEFNDPLLYPIRLMPVNKQLFTPQINKISSLMPSSPLLSQFNDVPRQMMCNESNIGHICSKNRTEFCSCIHLIEVSLNDLVEFIWVDENAVKFTPPIRVVHPMHVHGYKFSVIGIDTPPATEPTTVDYIKRLDREGKIKRNFDRPPLKDTVVVPVTGYTVLRFIADNPGIWMVHCHIDFHMDVGMQFF